MRSKRSKRTEKSTKEKIILQKSNRTEKKYMVTIGKKTIHFGSSPYKSYEVHKDKERMLRYLNRHRSRENWAKSGIKTAGFWSRWVNSKCPILKYKGVIKIAKSDRSNKKMMAIFENCKTGRNKTVHFGYVLII